MRDPVYLLAHTLDYARHALCEIHNAFLRYHIYHTNVTTIIITQNTNDDNTYTLLYMHTRT